RVKTLPVMRGILTRCCESVFLPSAESVQPVQSCVAGNLESISGAAHGLQIAWIFRVRLDFLTDTAHVDIHRARSNKAGVAPNRIEEVVAAEDAARMPRQIVEQPEFGGGRSCELAANLQLHGARVNNNLFKAND